MPSLKDIKTQINSVGSTRKITSAMKMVAASKLRRSQEKAEAARPYSSRLEEMLASLALVDFVVLSDFKNATKTISAFKPNFYVKGQDYNNEKRDTSKNIYDRSP